MPSIRQLLRSAALTIGLSLAVGATAGIAPVAAGFQVDYAIDMTPGTSSGNDITHVFIFESDGIQFNVDEGTTIAGTGATTLVHLSPFAPTSALIAGLTRGVPGLGDGKDHIYLVNNPGFSRSSAGFKWGEVFPGSGGTRVRHEEFINLLVDASAGNAPALAAIRDFAINDAAAAWFDPNGAFAVTEFSTVPADPVGHNVSVPGTLALLALGLAGAGGFHRSGRQRASS